MIEIGKSASESLLSNPTLGIRTKIDDLISSLLLLRAYDVHITKRYLPTITNLSVLPKRWTKFKGKVTESDVLTSVLNVPCFCPVYVQCCPGIRVNDLRYIVVFPHDLEFLNNAKIFKITDFREYFPHMNENNIKSKWISLLESKGMTDLEKEATNFSIVTSIKLGVWNKAASEIAIPLMNIFKAKSNKK